MLKDGKCAACGEVPWKISRVLEVYEATHADVRKKGKDDERCEARLDLTDAGGRPVFHFSICPACGLKNAEFKYVETKLVPKAICPNGCF